MSTTSKDASSLSVAPTSPVTETGFMRSPPKILSCHAIFKPDGNDIFASTGPHTFLVSDLDVNTTPHTYMVPR